MRTLALVLTICFAREAAAQGCAPIIAKYRNSVVRLSVTATVKATGAVRESFGTGVIVSGEGHVLTNNHVVDLGDDVEDVRIAGSVASRVAASAPLQLLAQNGNSDLAILQFDNSAIRYSAAPIGNPWSVAHGDLLCSGGFPLDLEFYVTSGVLGGKGGPRGWWVTELPANPGESGAPVFDSTGGVVAIKVGGRTDANDINLVVPVNLARPLLLITPIGQQLLATLSASADVPRPASTASMVECRVDRGRESTGGLVPSSDIYSEVCRARAGHRIVKADLIRESENNLSDVSVSVASDGSEAVLRYRLTSGPIYDRWRGWLNGRLVTEQTVR
jgi:S1-C subfamily serine protease